MNLRDAMTELRARGGGMVSSKSLNKRLTLKCPINGRDLTTTDWEVHAFFEVHEPKESISYTNYEIDPDTDRPYKLRPSKI